METNVKEATSTQTTIHNISEDVPIPPKKIDLSKLNCPILYPLYAFLISVLTFLISLGFLDILGYGNMTILRSDLNGQYLSFIQLFLRALRGETSFWYSFSLYFGSGTILNHAYYCFSPFNLLYLIDSISLSAMTTVIITLKLGLSASTFQIFVQKAMKQRSFLTVLFSCCYALCGYAVTMHYHLMWLDAFYMTPIIFWLIIRYVDSKKGLWLSISFAYCFILNFYTAYMIGIVSAIFFVCYLCYKYFHPNKNDLKECTLIAVRFAGYILLAVGLSAAILLPTAMFLISNIAEDNASFNELINSIPDIVNSMFIGQMQTLDTQVPMLYCGIPVLLILPFYFTNKEIPLKEKLCVSVPLLFLFISMIYLPLYKFMHAFDYPNMYGFRFVFLFVFFLVVIACRQLPFMDKISIKSLVLYCSVLLLLYSFLIPIQTTYYPTYYHINNQNGFLLNLIFVALWVILFYLFFHKKSRGTLLTLFSLLVLITELSVNSYICINQEEHGNLAESSTNTFMQTTQTAVNEIKQSDSSFFRIGVNNNQTYNGGSLFGYNSVTTFSSSDDYPLRCAVSHLGLTVSNRYISECGLTPITDTLFGVKYKIDINDNTDQDGNTIYDTYSVSQNAAVLPLGYMVSAQIVNYIPTDNPFYNQMQLLALMTENEYGELYIPLEADKLKTLSENMAMERAEEAIYFYHLSDVNDTSLISFSGPSIEGKTLYACFSQEIPFVASDSPRIISEPQGVNSELLLTSGCIVKAVTTELYDTPHDTVILQFLPTATWDYLCKNMYFYYLDDNAAQELYNDLSPGGLNITSYSDECIKGTVTATEERPILFTTIPYDSGWHAYVDGIETTTYTTLEDAFLSIILEPGVHEITLQYIPRGKELGQSITLATAIIYLGILLVSITRKKSPGTNTHSK